MEQNRLDTLFSPKSIAVIGASTEVGSVGNDIAKNLIEGDFKGDVFPVNPKTDTLFGVRCYPSIRDVSDTPDLAIIVVPAAVVPDVLREAGEKGVPAAIVISAGFRETGPEGGKLESEIAAIADEFGMALLGPNCLGFLHPKLNLNASFAPELPGDGSAAFFSQSGALMTAILDLARGRVGFSKFISTGNKARIRENDLLAYLAGDDATEAISFYAENLSDAPGLVSLGRAILSRVEPKPVIGIKSGRTESGRKASSSHTGALAGSDSSYDALFRQARMLRAGTLRELIDALSVFSRNPIPEGNNVAIITNAGGPGVLAADAAAASGLTLGKLGDETKARLREALPKAASVENPIDLLGDAKSDRYRLALEAAASEHGIDSIVVILTPQAMTEAEETAHAIAETKRSSGKPVVAVFSGGALLKQGVSILEKAGVSVFAYPEEGVRALALLSTVAIWRSKSFSPKREFADIDRDRAREVISRAYAEERTMLYEREAYEVLRAYGFPLLESRYVQSPEEAQRAAKEIGRPVALKIVSADIVHKSDVDGVMLGVAPENAGETYKELLHRVHEKASDAKLEGAMVVEMAVPGGKELIFGLKKEPGLGTVLVLGMGGIYTEIMKDASFRFSPIVREDAEEMLSELRSFPILQGARGEKSVDMKKIVELLERLSALSEDFPDITDIDVNPVLVFPDAENFRVVDARMRISKD